MYYGKSPIHEGGTMQKKIITFLLLGLFAWVQAAQADLTPEELRLLSLEERMAANEEAIKKSNSRPQNSQSLLETLISKYKGPGFYFESPNGLFSTKLVWRAQMRYTNPNRSDPRSVGNFTTREESSNFELRRVRMKIGGHGYKRWIKYYFEIDLQPSKSFNGGLADRSRVIDWRITIQPYEWFGLRVGQWKINFNRERVDSSGRQTFIERSIINRIFTIDRQVGVMAMGRFFKGTLAEMRYYVGVFNGEGRATNNDDSNMMWMARIQWNFLGRDLKWRQSDVKRHQKPTGSLAFAVASNKGRCTRWSSSGCGALDGFGLGFDEQFTIDQYVQEFAFKFQGLAIQQEFHWKNVKDAGTLLEHNFYGYYAQIGYFFNEIIQAIPEGIELAFRVAHLTEPVSAAIGSVDERGEYTFAINWFFAGHNNKFTVDYSHLTLDDFVTGMDYDEDRVRFQWDISF